MYYYYEIERFLTRYSWYRRGGVAKVRDRGSDRIGGLQ